MIPIMMAVGLVPQCGAGAFYNTTSGLCSTSAPTVITITDYQIGGILVVILSLIYALGENFGLWDKYFRRVDLKTVQGLEAALPSAELPNTISIGTEKWQVDRWLANKQSTDYMIVWDVKMHNLYGAVKDGEIITEKQLKFDFKAWKTWGNSFGIPFVYDPKGGNNELERENNEIRRQLEQSHVDVARLTDENMRLKQSPEAQTNMDVAVEAAGRQSGGLYGGTRQNPFDLGRSDSGGDSYTDGDDDDLEVS